MAKAAWQVREEQRLIEQFSEATVAANGVVRWNSNGQVPPADVLAVWAEQGFTFDRAASTAAREADTAKFVAEYRRREARRVVSAEERAEMRAAFGPGTVVVNVITGRRTRV